MNYLKLVLFTTVFVLLPSITFAANTSQLKQQRATFQLALKALKTNQIGQFNKLKAALGDYPLQPYLDYLYLRHRLDQIDETTIERFLKAEDNTFYAKRLRQIWLDRLARDKKWASFLSHYQPPQSTARQCLRLQALVATGNYQQAGIELPQLWLTGRSQHKNCDPIFTLWQNKKLLTDELRWQRVMLALDAQQFSLATYLAKPLKSPQPALDLISLWKKAHHSPLALLQQLAVKNQTVVADSSTTRDVIQHAIYRLARKSTDQAFELWQQIRPIYRFSEQDKLTIQRTIANRAALNREDRTLEFFADIPAEPWRVRAALWQQDWSAVNKAVLSLNLDELQQPRWQYWLARSQSELGQKTLAAATYQALSLKRDFYGFLAADQLQQPYQMNHNPIHFETAELERFRLRDDVSRLREFYNLDMGLEARRQAYALKIRLSNKELLLLATLTHQWGWHNQTIALLGKAQYWDALDLRFPIVYDSAILHASKTNGMDPSWLFGIARQESAFNPQARSHVGARGLMQLMPKTGKLIARLINQPLKSTSELLNPNRNIQLGSAYLRRMYDQNQHNPVLATASYNAGPHRVAHWLPNQELPADIWIENIPFTETRRYTQSVLSYTAIFDHQRKQTVIPLADRMPAVQAQKP
jgi:soluble lytic murein transglycosylase